MLASALQEEDAPEGEVAEDPLDVIRLRSLYTNKVSLTHINSFSKRALEHELGSALLIPENPARHHLDSQAAPVQEDTAEDYQRVAHGFSASWRGGYLCMQDVEGAEKEMEAEEAGDVEGSFCS